MSSRERAFAQVDVFSATPFLGNPVAVVLDADGLSDEAMARFARWTNLSETTFVLPPRAASADYRLRIFTPGGELPFAGHPTLGSAHAWLESGGEPGDPDVIVQECGAGLVQIRQTDAGLAFAAPATTRSGPLEPALLARVAAALGIGVDRVVAHGWVDNGPGWLAVQLSTAEEVLALDPDLSGVRDLMIGVVGAHPDGRFELRAFAPAIGVDEDPVTGSLNASVAQWLIGRGAAPSRYTASQGARVGREGTIAVTTDAASQVWVGGPSTTGIRGRVLI
ncbi:PhzF family phenazine biosynthesis protein [Microbacterium sp. LRZ72]|uniref:PhzF family phenazine biosynthesis protein n=1 Tax=Microbacterium sp. LRZ72 TaxID=2942481 RepID=UPI0029BA8AFB|nr:PhzF family phenazine biosynthesis protein [Microbacterium sp. LRZ72]MDX2377252.1 PhzF family phenazine biosynthesis protein [Microbacterium sp. LRZ72]